MDGVRTEQRGVSSAGPAPIAVLVLAAAILVANAEASRGVEGAERGWMATIGSVGLSAALVASLRRRESMDVDARPPILVGPWLIVLAALMLAMPAAGEPMAFFQRWWPSRAEITAAFRCDAIRWLALTATAFVLWPHMSKQFRECTLLGGVALAVIAAVAALYTGSAGRPLYRDDHPSFLFRMWLFACSAPLPVAWVPFWEAGHVDTSAAVTGAWLLGLPLWLIGGSKLPHEIYPALVPLAILGLPPLAAAVGARLSGAGVLGCSSAALLALGVSRSWFIWTLRFGTIPAGISAAMFPLAAGVSILILRHPRPTARHAVAWAAALVGMFHWPLATIMAIPLAIGILISPPLWTARRFAVFAAGTAMAALVLSPVAWAIVAHAGVGDFVGSPSTNRLTWAALASGLQRLTSIVQQSHPLVVTVGLVGAPLWGDRATQRVLWTTLAGLTFLSVWGDIPSAELQLTRAHLPLALLATLPAAHLIQQLLESPSHRLRLVSAAVLALLVLGAYEAIRQYRNRTNTPYTSMGDEPTEIAEWIAQNVPPGARVMFAGPTVHAYGGGHVAYLPVMSSRSMLACDFYHFAPTRREYEYPPRTFRQYDADVFEFLDLHNVAAVITYHGHWLRFFRKYPDHFAETVKFGRDGRKIAFLLKHPLPGLFVQNGGTIEERVNGLNVVLNEPTQVAVLRYQWSEGLRADPPARLFPFKAANENLRWIGIEPNGASEVRIRWSAWQAWLAERRKRT